MKSTLLAALLLLLSPVAFAQGQLMQVFTEADLEALAGQESWQELLTHLSDITPAQRSARWSDLLEQSALGMLQTYRGDVSKSWAFADAVVKQYPLLKKSKRFMGERAQVGAQGLDACLAAQQPARPPVSPACTDKAVSYLDADPTNADLAWSLARRTMKSDPTSAVRLFKKALEVQHGAKECADDGVKRSIGFALALRSEDPRVTDATAIASDLCWEQLKEFVLDRFIDGDRDFRKNTCPFLMRHPEALSPVSKKQCESLSK